MNNTKNIIKFENKFNISKPETISNTEWNKIKIKNKNAFIKYSKEAEKFSNPKEFVNNYLSKLKYEWDITEELNFYKNKSKTPYYDIFYDNISGGIGIIRSTWNKDFTPQKVQKAMILKVGRNYEDGFSGITIKAAPYHNEFIIRIDDGEAGNYFHKIYNHFPMQQELELDSLLGKFPNRLCINDLYPEFFKK